MASAPLENSSTPDGATSTDPSRSHGEFMEDRDTQSTRKRPRLDSGNLTREAMATDETAAGGENREPGTDSLAEQSAPTNPEPQTSQRPASRVTINVKSPTVPGSSDPTPSYNETMESPQVNLSDGDHSERPPSSTTNLGADVSAAISISSSPAPSLEIEVAEVEDMDQDPTTSNWRSLEDALTEQSPPPVVQIHDNLSIIDSFPRFRLNGEAREAVEDAANMFEKGHTHDTDIFVAVKNWFQTCLENEDQLCYDTFFEDREFWEEIPTMVEGLLRRPIDFQPTDGQGVWQCFEDFLVAYSRIALHIIRIDSSILALLANGTGGSIELLSRAYLPSLSWLLQINSIPFYRTMERSYGAHMPNVIARVNDTIQQLPVNAMQRLSKFTDSILKVLPQSSQVSTGFVLALNIVNNLVESGVDRQKYDVDENLASSPTLANTVKEAYSFIRPVDEAYQSAISKKSSWVTSESSEGIIRHISSIYQNLATLDPEFASQIAEDLSIHIPDDAKPEDHPSIISYSWKFGVLKKYITEGRMEIRVHGMDTLQNDLVHVWRQHIHGNTTGVDHALTLHLVKLLRDNKLVEYIVGVDSHPQLISRSGNVVGFLIVTSTYTDEDTDTIWKTVTESQDPRTVSEVLVMLTRTFVMHQASSNNLLYLCKKLVELPLNRFDTKMIEYCDQLLSSMRDKHVEKARHGAPIDQHVDVVPLQLCVRLIRETTSFEEFSVEHRAFLQRFACRQLINFLNLGNLGPTDDDKMEIYKQCIKDIEEMNEFTVGSIQALNALIPTTDSREITQLALDFDFNRLVITEFAHAFDKGPCDFNETFSRNGLLSRIQLLQRIIAKVPDTISPELSEMLWNSGFMSKNLGREGRSSVWDMLSEVTARCVHRNSFIERCMDEYLPKLLPEELSLDILAFAEKSVSYQIRFEAPHLAEEDQVISIPGMDRIWHFILTAAPNTIETKAIDFAIQIYLDHYLIRRAPRSAAEATHVALVDRCVGQLTSAAAKLKAFSDGTSSGEDEVMVIVAKDGEAVAEELRFSRSLLFLRQLLQGLRSRPQYSPPQHTPPRLPFRDDELKGEILELSYQAFSGSSQSKLFPLRIGDLATVSDLANRLKQLTGFANFSAFSGGQRLDLLNDADKVLRDLKLSQGLIIVRKQPESQDGGVPGKPLLSRVDSEVLKHFDELYNLLGLEEKLSKEIYDFLLVFPPQDQVRDLVKSESNTEAEMFPMEKPYKLLYSINSLAVCLREEILEAQPSQSFIAHSIQTLIAAITRPQMAEDLGGNQLKLLAACNYVECLLLALSGTAVYVPTLKTEGLPDTAKPSTDDPQTCFSDPELLVKRLLGFISLDQELTTAVLSEAAIQKLICNSFAVLFKSAASDQHIWDAVKQHTQTEKLLFTLLLAERRPGIRKGVADTLFAICGSPPPNKPSAKAMDRKETATPARIPTATAVDVVATIWKSLSSILPQAEEYATYSQEFFEVTIAVFQTVATLSPEDLIFGEYLRQWSEILLNHNTHEFVGRETVDFIVLGFTLLLKTCLDLAKNTSTSVDTSGLMEKLFATFLFPDLSEISYDQPIDPKIPVMHTQTRQEIYKILLLLCEDKANYETILELLGDVIPRGTFCRYYDEIDPSFSLCLGQTYEPNWIFDRYKTIRSPEGYAGLKNLSNTCYLNSLFTQLFMNLDFRKFLLEVPVEEGDSSQLLLSETKKVFAYMQNTWLKSVDTQAAVDTIRTYDNEPVDINIQMDVDEFYNLIFDRWESQILSAEDKKKFRSFYGGQLVQQIKSKECSHISERLEPFSAIQCEIKGRSGLEESLKAYVEGEIMQGDNKYSCTSCGRHVDAVKRACLKDLPDNLIFHLKRFDFDVISMMRSKINDEFHFPERIDMTPFKVDYLSNPNSEIEPDVFELVGVLVHSGTAESGHYYSYIRERPTAGHGRSWVEFNDADVTRFDPQNIPDQCFGGLNDPTGTANPNQVRFNKVWNAYMLFYQRVSSMETAKSVYNPSPRYTPVTIDLPSGLGNHIALENELFIRTYCLLDPYHAYFVRCILERSSTGMGRLGSVENQRHSIWMALDHLDQLVSRSKELPELEPIIGELGQAITASPRSALRILQWEASRDSAMRNLVLRSPHLIVRNSFCRLLLSALAQLQECQEDPSLGPGERARWYDRFFEMFDNVVSNLESLWSVLHLHSRAWDEYFDLLVALASIGQAHTVLLLDRGFLVKCLEIIWLDREDTKNLKRKYANYYRLVEKGRKYSHRRLFEFLHILLSNIDLALPPSPSNETRVLVNDKYSLTQAEDSLIRPIGNKKELLFLKKIVEQQANPPISRKIFRLFLDSEPELGMIEEICGVLEYGLRVEPAALCVPFLEAALVFCQWSPDERRVAGLIDFVAKGVDSISNSGGREHLAFFQNLTVVRNDRINKTDIWFWGQVIEKIPDWAPTLLIYNDVIVRNSAFEFLRQLLFEKEHEDLADDFRYYCSKIAKELAQACVDKLKKSYLAASNLHQHVDTKTVENINLVVSHCVETYYDESEEDMEFIQQAAAVNTALEQLAVDIPEELQSGSDFPSADGWDDNSMMGSDSEMGIAGSGSP
ncbi:hypothetical protein FQN54_000811 [Arachnomyces sp. PD_36]|nr:hypothetical protein FQN54_000811 [Arachnomyces sp. PD_36]